jgi:hypothetical protein
MKPHSMSALALILLAGRSPAQQTYRVPPARPDSAADAPGPEAAQPTSPARAAEAITLNLGNVVFSGNIQAFYVAGSGDVVNTFRLRRAELRLAGTISPKARWTVMLDPAKPLRMANGVPNQATTVLQDAFVTLKAQSVEIHAGQLVIPLTFEGSGLGSAVLETYDRSLMITDGKLGQVRDVGVMVTGPLTSSAHFRLGLFNGTGDSQNTTDVNGQKAVIGRLDVQTALPGLQVGMSGAYGGPDAENNPRRDRIGADARYSHDALGLRAELMRAWDGSDVKLGYYGLASYKVDDILLVGRYDVWNRDSRATPEGQDLQERDILTGFSWFIDGRNVQLRTNHVFRLLKNLPRRNLMVVSLQTAW